MQAFPSRSRVACKLLRPAADTAAATAKCYPSKIVSLVDFRKKLTGPCAPVPHGLPRTKSQDGVLYSGAVPRHDRKGWNYTQNVLRRDATGLIDFTAVI